VHLSMQEYKERTRSSRLPEAGIRPRSGGPSPETVLIWVSEPTKEILKSKHAPRSLFQVGSTLVALEKTHQGVAGDCNLFRLIDDSLCAIAMVEEWEPVDLGTYTLVSGGYELCAEITLLDWGDDWTAEDEVWWLLALRSARLLGTSEQSSIRDCIQHHSKDSV